MDIGKTNIYIYHMKKTVWILSSLYPQGKRHFITKQNHYEHYSSHSNIPNSRMALP